MKINQLYTELDKVMQEHKVTLQDAMLIGNHITANAQIGIIMEMLKDEKNKSEENTNMM